jgi:hypothetical protein
MSEGLISTLVAMGGTLLGAVVGGFITFLAMRSVERQRWQQERWEKLSSLKREGLAAALEWIEPMRNAEIRASSLLMAAIRGEIDDEHFLNNFPHLLGELVKRELSAGQRAVLPDTVYERVHRIVRELDEVRILGVKYGQEARIKGRPLAGFQECSDKLDAIGKQIKDLEMELGGAFRRTFGNELPP